MRLGKTTLKLNSRRESLKELISFRPSLIAFLTVVLLLPCAYSISVVDSHAQTAGAVDTQLCTAPVFSAADIERFRRAAPQETPNISILNNVVVLEYSSVYSVHTPLNPAQPIRSQPGDFLTGTILSDLRQTVDTTKYDFVLLYSLEEVPGWINSGSKGIPVPAKNIGLANSAYGWSSQFPTWPRLRSAPHMNSVDFINTGLGGPFIAAHEMGHYWCVYWAQRSPGPRGWKQGDPIAWLAAASSHWSYVWQPSEDAGIMYSGPLSDHFTAFDLYAMGLMGYSEASQTTYKVHEDIQPTPPNPVLYSVGLDDLIYSLSRAGSSYYEGNGHRIPDTDSTFQNLNTLVVVIKGSNNAFTDQQKNLILSLAQELPQKWNTATWGRSSMNVAIISPLSLSPSSQSFPFNGGSGSITINAASGFSWTATSNANWITLTSANGGTGAGALNYSVAANSSASPRTGTVNISGQTFTVTQAASPPPPPALLVDETFGRAAALDSVTFLRDPFPIVNTLNFSADHRTRISLFAVNVDLLPGENSSAVTAQAEDAQHRIYPATVEFVGKVPGFDWLTQINIKLPDELANTGEVWITISLRGVPSNKALINIHSQ